MDASETVEDRLRKLRTTRLALERAVAALDEELAAMRQAHPWLVDRPDEPILPLYGETKPC